MGAGVGADDGAALGLFVGLLLGDADGEADGDTEGLFEGEPLGEDDGATLGLPVGLLDGEAEGEAEGLLVGDAEAATTTLKASKSGSRIKVHSPPQQKHSLVAVFQLKKKGVDSFPLIEQYSKHSVGLSICTGGSWRCLPPTSLTESRSSYSGADKRRDGAKGASCPACKHRCPSPKSYFIK